MVRILFPYYIYEIPYLHILLIYIYLYIYVIVWYYSIQYFHLYNFNIDFVRVYEIIFIIMHIMFPCKREKKFLIQIISCRIRSSMHHVGIKINKILYIWCPEKYTNIGRCTCGFNQYGQIPCVLRDRITWRCTMWWAVP